MSERKPILEKYPGKGIAPGGHCILPGLKRCATVGKAPTNSCLKGACRHSKLKDGLAGDDEFRILDTIGELPSAP
jgi:hypothetical protein